MSTAAQTLVARPSSPVPSAPPPVSAPTTAAVGRTLVPARDLALVLGANAALALGGVIRDALLATYFGLSPSADALNLAWFLADVCGNAVLAAVAAAAVVPYLVAPSTGRTPARRLGEFLSAVVLLSGAAALTLVCCARPLVHLLAPEAAAGTLAQAAHGLRAMAPYVVTLPLLAGLTGALQVRRRFAAAAAASLVTTVFIVSGALLFGPAEHTTVLLAWIAAGSAAALILPVTLLRRAGVSVRLRWPAPAGLVHLWRLCAPIGAWLVLAQVGQAVDRYFAGTLGPGGVTGISYVAKFGQAPVWIFAAGVTLIVYPAVAEAAGAPRAQRAAVLRALGVILAGAIPLAAVVGLGAHPLIDLVLAHGRLTAGDAARVASGLAAFAPGIPAAAATVLLCRALFASPVPARALWGAGATLAAGVVGDALLAPRLGLAGIGLSGALAQWAGALVCLWLVFRPIQAPGTVHTGARDQAYAAAMSSIGAKR